MSRLPIEHSLETINRTAGGHYSNAACLLVGSQSEASLQTEITMAVDYDITLIPDSKLFCEGQMSDK